MSGICLLTITSLILLLQTTVTHASVRNITLVVPQTKVLAQIGEELYITCEAFTCDKPEFTWASLMDNTLSGTVNTLGQKSTLTMKVNTESDGSYRCAVSCDKPPGEKSFKIVVYSFPIEPILSISSAVAGEQAHITCTFPNVYHSDMMTAHILLDTEIVASYDGLAIGENWEKIQNISLSHDLILEEKNDGNKIQCVGEMPFEDFDIEPIKSDTSMDLNLLYPPVKPHIVLFPSATVRAGDKVTLTCISESTSQVAIWWVKVVDGKEMEAPFDSQGSLILPSAEPEDSGVYICYANNNVGSTSSHVEITVQAPPKNTDITIVPSPEVREGEPVQIMCTSHASPAPRLVLKQRTEHGLIELESGNGQYNISHVGMEHTGTYICESTNAIGQQTAETTLTVQVPPKNTDITIVPSPEVREGEPVQIMCTSHASPAPRLVLKQRTEHGLIELESGNGQYNISHIGMEHTGTYICESANAIGQQTAETTLTVQVPPKNTDITIVPSPEVREGEPVQIMCTSHASPAPRLVLKQRTEHGLIDLESGNGQYNISHVGMEHSGTYICESTNAIGQQTAETTLTVQVSPKNTNITITPSPLVKEGDSVWIKCTSEASPSPTLVLKLRTEHSLMELDSENGQYNITYAGMEHTGTYLCDSRNIVGEQTAEITLVVQIRSTTVVMIPSQNVTQDITDTITTVINIIGAEQQKSPRFNPTGVIIGSVAFVSAASIIGGIIYHVRQAKVQGSYNLV